MVNPFILTADDDLQEQPENLILATVAGVYADGLSLIPDDQAEATQKHYKYLASAYPAPAAGDRVVVMKMSGTYIVMGALGGSGSLPAANTVFAGPASGDPAAAAFRSLVANDLPVVPIEKGGTGQTGTVTTSTVSEILVPETGFACDWAYFSQFGKLVTISAILKAETAVTTNDWTTWATLVAGKRPPYNVAANFTRSTYCLVQNNGAIRVSQQVSAGMSYIFSATYLLP